MITRHEVHDRMEIWLVNTITDTMAYTTCYANIVYRGRFYSTSRLCRTACGGSLHLAALLHSKILRDIKETTCATLDSTSRPS